MFVGLQAWLETDPGIRERAQMHWSTQTGLKSLVERSVTDEPMATLLGKIDGGIGHWPTFVGEPAISPTNNAAENALREPVVLWKIIGTLRDDRGMFVPETVLSLLATRRQQGCNAFEELQRGVSTNSMILRSHAVRAVEPSG